MPDIKVGDHVKVTLEGVVTNVYPDGSRLRVGSPADSDLDFAWIDTDGPVALEKIEPPVEVFKPGDRIRSKCAGYVLDLGTDGYLQHFDDGGVHFYKYIKYESESFNTKNFEKVSIG